MIRVAKSGKRPAHPVGLPSTVMPENAVVVPGMMWPAYHPVNPDGGTAPTGMNASLPGWSIPREVGALLVATQ